LKLAGMTASVATSYAASRIKTALSSEEKAEQERERYHDQAGTRIAKTLGELKGAVMKVGQMASIATDVLPKEIVDALGTLQREAPPMDFEVIAGQIESELGSPPEALFESFDRTPFASASIGQVHRARTDDGREVVVKVQYPGVDDAVDSDLTHLKMALRASGLIKIPRASLNASMKELRERLHEELDYCIEADNVRMFREFHAEHSFVVVPDVVGERSSQRVLTLEFQPGHHLDELDREGYTQEERNVLGRNLFDLMASQIFEFGAIHGDPNPGNFAFRRDGTVVLYDYGCVKHLRRDIIGAYRNMIVDGLAEEYDKVEQDLRKLGIRNLDGPQPEFEYYKMWRDIVAEPFLATDVFDYHLSTIQDEIIKKIPTVLKRMESFQAAPELIFLDRMVVGHYGNMRTLRTQIPTLRMLRGYIEDFDPANLPQAAEPPSA
jgi:predicted unusual protein kinase regulating ubiquinone biosynthesis (AarF/ABC1/UbiB family)